MVTPQQVLLPRHHCKRYSDWRDPPTACDCCGCPVEFCSHEVLYEGKEFGEWPFIYYCKGCGASIGVHPYSIFPLGTMADSATRRARSAVHAIIDPMWKSGRFLRSEVYSRMAKLTGRATFHTGELSLQECHDAVAAFRAAWETVDDFGPSSKYDY